MRPEIFVFPLSFAQQRLWFLDQLEPDSPWYNVSGGVCITGHLDFPALERTFNDIVQRHEILRTTFTMKEGQPLQVVAPELRMSLPLIDLSELSEKEREAETSRMAREEAQRPFHLATGPLMRATLLRLGEEKHILLLTMHHIISDGWSLGVLFRELTELSAAFSAGRPSPLPALPIQYADFAVWQRQWLQGEVLERQLSYWKRQLSGELPLLELPHDRPRPAEQTFRGATQSFLLPAELSLGLKELSRSTGATLFMVLLAAFQTLLHRYTGQEDIIVGSPIANRNRAEIEGLIGFFVNTLALRSDLSGNPTFRELLGRVKETTLGAYAHQDLPFEMLVEALQPERTMSHSPIFQVMFALQNAPMSTLTLPGMIFDVLKIDGGMAKFDLTLNMEETPQGLAGGFEYNIDLFDPGTISRMIGHFRNLLEGIISGTGRRVSEFPIITECERRQLLTEWNDAGRDYPQDKCIHQLFEARAEKTPDAVAVVFEDRHLTYRELNSRANQLAHYLRKLGVGPDVLVGICMDRSLEMVVGLLGILKAGGAYLPLDPAYPQDRLAFMLEDAGVPVLLTQEHGGPQLPACNARVVDLDRDAALLAGQSERNPAGGATPGNLAYVIYTSGSTGRPKGVTINHQNAVRLFAATESWFSFSSDDVWTLFHSYAFDFSVWELWGALLYGGRLVVVPYMVSRSPELFYELLCREGVTVLNQTPSAFRQLMRAEEASELSAKLRLRLVIFGGEALELQSLRPWFERHGDHSPRLVNMYGITETTVHVTYRPLTRADLDGEASVIGRPIPDLQLYILDPQQQPAPMGVAGEMYVGGAGLSPGYLNRPELTAERFIPNPFSNKPGSRLYRSGDLARRLPDGDIEYLGRIDHQVKVRGFRIELGEIEAALMKHGGIGETIVLAREDQPGDKRLTAYLVCKPGEQPSTNSLRAHLKESLPDYMVPSVFLFLEALPLTPNGKVDRKALPVPEGQRPELESTYTAPRTPVEKTLADIWGQILGVDRVGIHDNFFELGGDSILGIQVVARAGKAGIRLTPKQIFQHQSIAALAAAAERMPAVQAEQGTVTGPAPLTPIQRWFLEQDIVDRHHWNQSVLLELKDAPDPAVLESAFRHILQQHDALRLRFLPAESGWRQHFSAPDETVPFVSIDVSDHDEAEQAAVIEKAATETQASLNVSEGPLMRAALFTRGAGKPSLLLIAVHHLAIDGVSWRILLEDLQNVCSKLARGEDVRLPSKTTSFRQWAERLTDYARSSEIEKEKKYWEKACPPTSPLLPGDRSREDNTVGSARNVSLSLSEEETQALVQAVPRAYHTRINDILLTALAQTFAWWTGEQSLLIDLEGHGREDLFNDVDLSRTVGWFTSMFPVCLHADIAAGPGETLKSIKEQLRSVPNNGIGYGVLRYLSPDEEIRQKLRALPEPEVSFNYLGQFDQSLSESSFFKLKGSAGAEHGPLGKRKHLLDINSLIMGGRLQITWTYSERSYFPATIESLAQGFLESLRSLISHCTAPGTGGYTPSDFPLAGLNQATLDRIAGKVGEIEDIYPLSPMQQGILFHSRYSPDSGEYFEQLRFIIHGQPDIPSFERAWQRAVDRHPVLRTAFHWDGFAQPIQIVERQVELPAEQQDWRGLTPSEQRERLKEYCEKDKRRGFDFSRAPLMRLALIRLAEDAYQCIWSHHHLLIDGWSLPLLLKEILTTYEADRRGQAAALELSRPYRDHIAWLLQQDKSKAESFWRETLKGFISPTPLGIDRAIPASGDQADYEEQHITLSRTTTEGLKTLARRHQLTLNTLVQGAWALLLSRYSSEEDVVFGSVVSGRPAELAGVDSMVGLFINTLPVRARISPERPLLSWLKELQDNQAELRQYEYSALVDIHGWSEVPRGLPLFESIVIFENYPVDAPLQDATLKVHEVRMEERTNYPLTILAGPGNELLLKILYSSLRFDSGTVSRVLGHFQTLLESILSNPDRPLSDLPLLTETERRQVLTEWNNTGREYPKDKCIHELFEVQAEKTPDAPAVVFEDQRLTYRELNERSNQLAHCLLESGVGPEVLVGICAERSLEMVIGLLGILKAGGAYVPLDPAYPGERLAFMMEDADVPVLLIQEHLRDKLPGCRARVFCLDDPNLIKDKQIGNPGGSVTGHNLAYMIYTSGSTGRPKGAMNSHQGIRNRLLWMQEAYGLTHYDRVLQKTPFSFDVSVWEFFWPLMFGACLVMARPGGHQDSSYLVDVIRKQQITTIHFVPSMLQLFLGEQYLSECRSLRRVICSGEALPFELQRRFFACLNAELHNLYGPTEASVDVTSWACERKEQGRIVPIGYPIANIQTYILDKGLEPVPVGIAGELFLGGTGLGRGYLKRPDLTAEKFIPDLYGGRGSRIYRTGDLARWLPDGSIEYLGRLDHQVKIRGLRIELGEIEAVLMAHPGIREAVVTAREDVPGDKRLVAYVVPAGGAAPAGELRAYLKETLPDYMVPSAFAVLEVLPLSPNGKADRKALPAPDGIRPELESGYAAPRTLVEKTLTDIWGQVLRVDRVGIHDNFFNLGGHSLLATQVVSRIREVFQAEVSLRSFFDAPTIAELASIVERGPEPMYQSEIAGADAVAVSGYDREEGEI